MSNSQHPRALSVERRVSDSTRLLAVVMLLPLVDGVFVAVVLGGALDSAIGILEVGLLIFGGSAMVAVILAEMDAPPRKSMGIVLAIGSVVIALAAVQATLAPTIESAVDMVIFERFAALVVLAVAAATASAKIAEYLPSPALIIALGLVATVSPSEATLTMQTDPELIIRAVAAASVGVAFGLVLAATSPWLREVVELDRFRFGSAVALGVLAVSIAGFLPSEAPVALLVLGLTALLAFDPGGAAVDTGGVGENTHEDHSVSKAGGLSHPISTASQSPPISDGGEVAGAAGSSPTSRPDASGEVVDERSDSGTTTGLSPGQERPPWI